MGSSSSKPASGSATGTKFGHAMLDHFALDPNYLNLNNGGYGSPPKAVLDYAQKLTARIEANPDLFLKLELPDLVADVRAKIAPMIGAEVDEVVLTNNASMGLNTVLRNFEWTADDVIIVFNTTYNSIFQTANYLCDIPPHPKLSICELQYPPSHASILQIYKDHIKTVQTNGRKVVVIDGMLSLPGYYMPWMELVKISRDAGIMTVVDAAHCLGQEPDIDLSKTQPDFWVANCHKWFYAKRAVAVLYVPKRNQHLIRSSIPTSDPYTSNPSPATFVSLFTWTGTIDYAPYLSIVEALKFRQSIGGERAITNYIRATALEGGKAMAKVMGTTVLDDSGEATLAMVNVSLPLSNTVPVTTDVNLAFFQKLLKEKKAFAHIYYLGDKWWARCSAQIWTEVSDFVKMGNILIEVCEEIEKEFGGTAQAEMTQAASNPLAVRST